MWYNRQVNESWPLSQTVKTSPSHGEDMGSIPVGVTTGSFKDEAANLFRAISSAGRAPGSQSGGQGFDPPWVHQTGKSTDMWVFSFFILRRIKEKQHAMVLLFRDIPKYENHRRIY